VLTKTTFLFLVFYHEDTGSLKASKQKNKTKSKKKKKTKKKNVSQVTTSVGHPHGAYQFNNTEITDSIY
jgi:fructose/tagatose bisphosphate aldolase